MKQILLILMLLLVAGPSQAAPNGDRLYQDKCEACHGKNGRGGVGVPLSLPAFQRDASDEFLKKTIQHGRPGRVMPAFMNLSEAQLSALIKTLRSFVDQPLKPGKTPATIRGNAARGSKLYAGNCTGCHGAQGEGGKGTGVTFSRPRDAEIIAPSLRNPGFQLAASDKMIWQTLAHGREGTPMPSFLKQGLSEQQISDLVAYIRTLEPRTPTHAMEPVPPFLHAETEDTLEEVLEAVKKAVVAANFRLIRVQKFEQGMVKQDTENPDKIIVYFCNFGLLNKALAIDPRVGLFLPCRLTLVRENDKITLYTMNPETVSGNFNNLELEQLCQQMRATYEAILEEVTL
ncbi:MAG TPA: c-type cytochrome [Gammaproteobacteria bacterium]|mgnify:CR=1 FL=1|nr:c-type cytochrome [Gammaproteobacteria bacterium]